ncbi:MAG: hypothetical protein GY950_35345, partial [bacterium]|nr:hypothetical protein [bacterium]
MEKVRKIVKKYYLRQIMAYWLACWMFFGLPAQVAMATPAGGVVSPNAGGANIAYNQGGFGHTTTVDVLTGET